MAAWVSGLTLDDIPAPVQHAALRSLIDTIGVMIAANRHPLLAKVNQLAESQYRDGPCGAVGGQRLSGIGAALVNGTAAHAFDFDDTSYTGIMHGSAVSLPAVLAAAEFSDTSGEEFLTTFIVALEATYAIAVMGTDAQYLKGRWTSGTMGMPAAAAGAARALGLDADQTATAIGLATVEAFGIRAMFGTDAKPLLSGRASAAALSAALAAAEGITGPHGAFESPRGYIGLINDGIADPRGLADLGTIWRLIEPGIFLKRFPLCSAAHAPADAIEAIMKESAASPEQIAHVVCEVPQVVAVSLVYDSPTSPQEAQFSLPFAVACMAIHGRIGLEHLSSDCLADARMRSLMTKVRMAKVDDLADDPDAPEGCRLTVSFANGTSHVNEIRVPKGMPQNPLDDDEIADKFRCCTSYAGWSTSDTEDLLDRLWA
ncbi:MAG: MmgE/PrpD family protein [Hyphomicrobiaceae bacterium]